MTNDELRAIFESHFPLPPGVHWDGDHYMGTTGIIGSWPNATIWAHMYRGWTACAKEFVC